MIGFESRNLATLRSSQATSILPRKPFWRKGKIAAGKVTRQESAKKYLRLSGQFGQVEIVLGGTAALHASRVWGAVLFFGFLISCVAITLPAGVSGGILHQNDFTRCA